MKFQIKTNVVFLKFYLKILMSPWILIVYTWAFGQMITWNWWWVYWKAFGLFPLLDVGMKRQGETQTKLFRVFSLRRRLFSSQQDYRTDLGLASTHIDRVDNLKTKSEPSLFKKNLAAGSLLIDNQTSSIKVKKCCIICSLEKDAAIFFDENMTQKSDISFVHSNFNETI